MRSSAPSSTSTTGPRNVRRDRRADGVRRARRRARCSTLDPRHAPRPRPARRRRRSPSGRPSTDEHVAVARAAPRLRQRRAARGAHRWPATHLGRPDVVDERTHDCCAGCSTARRVDGSPVADTGRWGRARLTGRRASTSSRSRSRPWPTPAPGPWPSPATTSGSAASTWRSVGSSDANDLGARMWDDATCGGYDGLTPLGPNLNEGAESTLALITTMQYAAARSATRAPAPAPCSSASAGMHPAPAGSVTAFPTAVRTVPGPLGGAS